MSKGMLLVAALCLLSVGCAEKEQTVVVYGHEFTDTWRGCSGLTTLNDGSVIVTGKTKSGDSYRTHYREWVRATVIDSVPTKGEE